MTNSNPAPDVYRAIDKAISGQYPKSSDPTDWSSAFLYAMSRLPEVDQADAATSTAYVALVNDWFAAAIKRGYASGTVDAKMKMMQGATLVKSTARAVSGEVRGSQVAPYTPTHNPRQIDGRL